MRYHQLGQVPRKRHVQFRDDGRLLVEEVLGFEGFSGNESILYHLQSPCRISEAGEFEPLEHEEWVPDAHVHRHLETGGLGAEGDPITGRRTLMWNADLETVFGTVPFAEHDYIYVPRGTTYRFSLDSTPQLWLVFHTPGEIETPNRYRNRYGQLLESAPFSQRDFHPPR